MTKPTLIWVDIDLVLPNSKNPRKDPGVKSVEIQNIIRSKGWEEGITVYKKGAFYIILSGHRRWYAGKRMKIREVPIYIVESPEDDSEELLRLGSIQGGQVDWNGYEWAAYTAQMYKILGGIPYGELARKFNVSTNLIGARIRVYNYYPANEIEEKVANEMYSITMLDYIRGWIERAKKHHRELIDSMGEDTFRKSMLKKLEHKCFTSEINNDEWIVKCSDKELVSFITDINKKLSEAKNERESNEVSTMITNVRHNQRKLRLATKEVNKIKYTTKYEAEKFLASLESMEQEIEAKKSELKEIYTKDLILA